jgi:hypothetical protein
MVFRKTLPKSPDSEKGGSATYLPKVQPEEGSLADDFTTHNIRKTCVEMRELVKGRAAPLHRCTAAQPKVDL